MTATVHYTPGPRFAAAEVVSLAFLENAEPVLREIAERTREHGNRRLLINLLDVVGTFGPEQQHEIGLLAYRYLAHLEKQHWDAVVIDESHNVTNDSTQNNRLARLLSQKSEALILASATPHNGKAESFAELIRMLEPSAVTPEGELVEDEVRRLIIRRHRHSPDVANVVGSDWAERLEPHNLLVDANPVEDEIAHDVLRHLLFRHCAARQGLNARQEFGVSIRLRQIIVATRAQAFDAVIHVAQRRQDQHLRAYAARPECLDH